MSDHYDAARTGLLLVDPYNDFLSEGGKLWPMVKEVAGDVDLLDNLRAVLRSVRQALIQVFVVPHRRWEPGDYEGWDQPNPSQLAVQKRQTFARGTWGVNGIRISFRKPAMLSQRTLGAKWLRQYRPRLPAQAARRLPCHRSRAACQYLHRVNQSVREWNSAIT